MCNTHPELFELLISRKHRLLYDTNPGTKTVGKITFECKICLQISTVSKKSYFLSVQGCPKCKANNTGNKWRGRKRNTASEYKTTKRRVNMRNPSPEYLAIGNRANLIDFLKKKNDDYTNFMLSCMQKYPSPPVKRPKGVEGHHIIPIHAGGPNVNWNLIWLPPYDHFNAHQIRFAVYQEKGDKLFMNLKLVPPDQRKKRKYDPEYYSSERQSARGKIGGTVQSAKKDEEYRKKLSPDVDKLLQSGSVWVHNATGTKVTLGPNQISLLRDLAGILGNALPDGNEAKGKLLVGKGSQHTSLFSKVIKGERQSHLGWYLIKE